MTLYSHFLTNTHRSLMSNSVHTSMLRGTIINAIKPRLLHVVWNVFTDVTRRIQAGKLGVVSPSYCVRRSTGSMSSIGPTQSPRIEEIQRRCCRTLTCYWRPRSPTWRHSTQPTTLSHFFVPRSITSVKQLQTHLYLWSPTDHAVSCLHLMMFL